MGNEVIFSVKYPNPDYDDEIWAADWKWRDSTAWSVSRSPRYKMRWELERYGLDKLARKAILEKFGLLEWQRDYPLGLIEKMSPADLVKERREKERIHNRPYLEITSDNICLELGKGQIPHYAEDYS